MSLDFELVDEDSQVVFNDNITHNLNKMAVEAGIYYALWRPEEVGYYRAKQIIPVLTNGLVALISDPKQYEAFNSPNGWGMYEHFVLFVLRVLTACRKHPNAFINVDR